MKKPDQCNRCLAGTMRVVTTKRTKEGRRQHRKCSNPKCNHLDTRDVPSADKSDG